MVYVINLSNNFTIKIHHPSWVMLLTSLYKLAHTGNLKCFHLWRLIMPISTVCTVDAGLGAGMASGSQSGAEKKRTQMPSGQICLWWERQRARGKVYLTGGGQERNKDRRRWEAVQSGKRNRWGAQREILILVWKLYERNNRHCRWTGRQGKRQMRRKCRE